MRTGPPVERVAGQRVRAHQLDEPQVERVARVKVAHQVSISASLRAAAVRRACSSSLSQCSINDHLVAATLEARAFVRLVLAIALMNVDRARVEHCGRSRRSVTGAYPGAARGQPRAGSVKSKNLSSYGQPRCSRRPREVLPSGLRKQATQMNTPPSF